MHTCVLVRDVGHEPGKIALGCECFQVLNSIVQIVIANTRTVHAHGIQDLHHLLALSTHTPDFLHENHLGEPLHTGLILLSSNVNTSFQLMKRPGQTNFFSSNQ